MKVSQLSKELEPFIDFVIMIINKLIECTLKYNFCGGNCMPFLMYAKHAKRADWYFSDPLNVMHPLSHSSLARAN